MAETNPMATVSLHYWAAAKAAAGVAEEKWEAASVADALAMAGRSRTDPRLASVIGASTVLIDGLAARAGDLSAPLDGPVRVEVLPPFAGGA